DGKPYRFAGPQPATVPPLKQTRLSLTPTRTTYTFEGAGIRLDVAFLSPLLPNDLDLLSRPVTYVTWEARSADGATHSVQLYLDCSAEWAVNQPDQEVVWSREKTATLMISRIGTRDQPILANKGDDLRI